MILFEIFVLLMGSWNFEFRSLKFQSKVIPLLFDITYRHNRNIRWIIFNFFFFSLTRIPPLKIL